MLSTQSCNTPCQSPNPCCSSRALLLPPSGFPAPSTRFSSCQDLRLLAQGTDAQNSGVPPWDLCRAVVQNTHPLRQLQRIRPALQHLVDGWVN